MPEVIEGEFVSPKTTADVFIVMNRYGSDYWSACTSWKTLDEAQQAASRSGSECEAWQIVKVTGLPIRIGETNG